MKRNCGRTRSDAAGFTLLELVVVTAVIAVLYTIAAPKFANSLARYHAQAAAQRIAADISLAQRTARTSSAGLTVTFSVASNSYSLPGVTGLSGSASTYNVVLSADPYTANLVSVNFANTSALTFDRFGQPAAAGSVIVQSGTVQKTISVDGNSGLTIIQ